MVLVVALTTVGTAASDEEGRVTVQTPTPPAASRATATPTITGRRVRTSVLNRTVVPFAGRAVPRLPEDLHALLGISCMTTGRALSVIRRPSFGVPHAPASFARPAR